jgi:hypothetical protein
MKKNIIIAVLAVICLGLAGFMGYGYFKQSVIKPEAAKAKAEAFINKFLLSQGITVVVGDVTKSNGMYKMPLTLSNGQKADSYITKDGQLFFPEALNIDEIIAKEAQKPAVSNTPAPDAIAPQGTLKTDILKKGTGTVAVKSGDTITVDYTGTLEDGTQFDSSIGKQPFTFTVGKGSVIKGWDQGLIGMKVGEERKLTIPSDLGYGSAGSGSLIPPNATLIFTVKLISIK